MSGVNPIPEFVYNLTLLGTWVVYIDVRVEIRYGPVFKESTFAIEYVCGLILKEYTVCNRIYVLMRQGCDPEDARTIKLGVRWIELSKGDDLYTSFPRF